MVYTAAIIIPLSLFQNVSHDSFKAHAFNDILKLELFFESSQTQCNEAFFFFFGCCVY